MRCMKDQKNLVGRCISNEIPVFVITGNDALAMTALHYYCAMAEYKHCNGEFIEDLKCLINDFEKYQKEEKQNIKLPD